MSILLVFDLLQVLLILTSFLLLVSLALLAGLLVGLIPLNSSLSSLFFALFLHLLTLHHFLHDLIISLFELFFSVRCPLVVIILHFDCKSLCIFLLGENDVSVLMNLLVIGYNSSLTLGDWKSQLFFKTCWVVDDSLKFLPWLDVVEETKLLVHLTSV